MDAGFAERFPVLTFASGPTNSIRGAAFLSGVGEAIVVDIGGTTSDVGSLHEGFPRPASVAVEVAATSCC
jgi:N-methylhydantoinase A/oxoprolinase/acetone carboxylase beta subunit